jgi:hypothetical protein
MSDIATRCICNGWRMAIVNGVLKETFQIDITHGWAHCPWCGRPLRVELKPCPFCGSRETEVTCDGGVFPYRRCKNCMSTGPRVPVGYCGTKDSDVDVAWNRRVGGS